MKHLLKKLVGGGSDTPSFKKKYKLGGVLGEGSCGVVHVAVDLVDGKEWACKIITKETERRLAREEIRLLQRLSHPNVLQYREHFDKRSKLCIVTELLRGQDLFSDIEERGSYTEEQSRVIMKQLLEGIAHMHSRNIVHRDLVLPYPADDPSVYVTTLLIASCMWVLVPMELTIGLWVSPPPPPLGLAEARKRHAAKQGRVPRPLHCGLRLCRGAGRRDPPGG